MHSAIASEYGRHWLHAFHIAGRRSPPRYMASDALYRRYLRETGKTELSRRWVSIKSPDAAQRELDYLLSKPWGWWGIAHNCATFVEQIVKAGGNDAGLYSNCPALEHFQ